MTDKPKTFTNSSRKRTQRTHAPEPALLADYASLEQLSCRQRKRLRGRIRARYRALGSIQDLQSQQGLHKDNGHISKYNAFREPRRGTPQEEHDRKERSQASSESACRRAVLHADKYAQPNVGNAPLKTFENVRLYGGGKKYMRVNLPNEQKTYARLDNYGERL